MSEKVAAALAQGQSKQQIWRQLADNTDREILANCLNAVPETADQQTWKYLNLLLAGILSFVTSKKIYAVITLDYLTLPLVATLLVPAINIYLLRLILHFRRTGYQYLFVLSILALVHAENRQPLELVCHLALIGFSAFLYSRLFPASKRLPAAR